MKTKIRMVKSVMTVLLLIIVILSFINASFAADGKYKLIAKNLKFTSANSLEFDIMLLNTGKSKEDLMYAAGQYFMEFNPEISNGGKMTYFIVSSDLPSALRPGNASVSGNLLRLSCNMFGNSVDIPSKSPGLLIVRMKLETSADKFSSVPVNLKWAMSNAGFTSKICAFNGDLISDITMSENHITEFPELTEVSDNLNQLPSEFSLAQNYPNPFNPTTKISYDIPASNFVTLKVFDITGKEIALLVSENMNAGRYEATFNGANFASGVYFYKITAGSFSSVKRMVLIK